MRGEDLMSSSDSLQAYKIQREELRAAVAKAAELRALHAALLLQGSSSSSAALVSKIQQPQQLLQPGPGASPSLSRSSHQLSAEDYPVFTPSYEEEPLPGYQYTHSHNRSLSDNWSGIACEDESRDDQGTTSYTKTLSRLTSNQLSKRSTCTNLLPFSSNASGFDMLKSASRRTCSGEFNPLSTNHNSKPVAIARETDAEQKTKNIISRETSADSQPSVPLHPKHKGAILSWLFPKSKRKSKLEMSPNVVESEDMSQILKQWGVFSIEMLKKELVKANENKDAALAEVSEMKSSLGELTQKLVSLESYCEDLKKALKQAMHGKDFSKRAKPASGVRDSLMPVSQDVLVEGFLQIVSEARLSVKQFSKTLINQIEDTDDDLREKLNMLLQPHQMTMSNKYSKGVLYHLESIVNQSLYQDFENCVFQKNGSPKSLDPQQDRLENFSSFVALRNLSWNEVLQKGTKHYCEDFSKFCDLKMSDIVSVLNWSRSWPEQLLHSFFVSAKCIWLLHLLAFSFNPPLLILRVEGDRSFDPLYMEDVLLDRQRAQTPTRVKFMVMPGFYVQDKVLRCRVLCRYRPVP